MSLLPGITSGLRSLLRRKRVGQELDEELSAFLEMAAEEKMKQRHKPQRGTSRSATGTGKPRSHKGSGLCETLALTVIGIAVGIPCAMAAALLIAHLLFNVTPYDPGTLALVPLVLLAVGALASYIRARRAMKVDPLVALRHE